MLGGGCSKCCTKDGLKCYVPADDFGQCCKLSDGSCQNVRSCECLDGDAAANFYPGQECGDCYRYCRDSTTVRDCVVTNTPIPEEVDNAVEVPPGGPCECCPQVDPQRQPMFDMGVGIAGESCGCCSEYPATKTELPSSVECSINTSLWFSGTYTLPATSILCGSLKRWRWFEPEQAPTRTQGENGPCRFYDFITGLCGPIQDPPTFVMSEITVSGIVGALGLKVLFSYYSPTSTANCGCQFLEASFTGQGIEKAICGLGQATGTLRVPSYFETSPSYWDIGTITIGGSSNPLP